MTTWYVVVDSEALSSSNILNTQADGNGTFGNYASGDTIILSPYGVTWDVDRGPVTFDGALGSVLAPWSLTWANTATVSNGAVVVTGAASTISGTGKLNLSNSTLDIQIEPLIVQGNVTITNGLLATESSIVLDSSAGNGTLTLSGSALYCPTDTEGIRGIGNLSIEGVPISVDSVLITGNIATMDFKVSADSSANGTVVLKTDVVDSANVKVSIPRWTGATGNDIGTFTGANGTYPNANYVHSDAGNYGPGGTGYTPVLSALANWVLISDCTFPGAGNVSTTNGNYGISGNIAPTLNLTTWEAARNTNPGNGNVLVGVSYKIANTTYGGLFAEGNRNTDPGIANVVKAVTYKILNTSYTGTYDNSGQYTNPGVGNVVKGVTYKYSNLTYTGTFDESARNTDPTQGCVALGVSYKICNVAKSGTLVVSVTPETAPSTGTYRRVARRSPISDSPLLWTYRDAIEHLWTYAGALPQEAEQRRARQAIQTAYRELTSFHDWQCYFVHDRINLVAPYDTGNVAYDSTGGTYERQLTLTDGTWPEWAAYGSMTIGSDTTIYKVSDRKSDSVVTLDPEVCPTADITSTTYTLWRSRYSLPADIVRVTNFDDTSGGWGARYVPPDQWLYVERHNAQSSSVPIFWTIMGDPEQYGTLTMRVWGYPSEATTLDYIGTRRPRPLGLNGYDLYSSNTAGTTVDTTGSTTQTVTTAGFTPTNDLLDAVIRFARADATSPPSGFGQANSYLEQRIISAVAGTSTAGVITLDCTTKYAIQSQQFSISDPIDLPEYMMTAFQRGIEYQWDLLCRRDKAKLSAIAYTEALEGALAKDAIVRPPTTQLRWGGFMVWPPLGVTGTVVIS